MKKGETTTDEEKRVATLVLRAWNAIHRGGELRIKRVRDATYIYHVRCEDRGQVNGVGLDESIEL